MTAMGKYIEKSVQVLDGPPTEPGWYIGRHKTQGWPYDRSVFKVARQDSDTLLAWQIADERPFPIDRIEFLERFWP
jgi:DMSO/TMAO reductase YedYZ molybdopterin-dependent catalytic subunit